MRALLTFLSEGEVERIHEASLRILKETGVKVLSEKVRRLLAENGAEVDGDIVKIPGSLVEEAIRRAPQEMTLCAREPKCDLKIPAGDSPFLSTSGFSPFVDDFETGERRKPTRSDLRDFAIVSDYLDTLDYFWPIVIPGEVSPPLQELHALAISLENNRKHIQCSCVTEKIARWQIRLASAIAGGEEELKKKPIFSTIHCPVAPLTFEKDSSDAMVMLARAGIPTAPMTMVLAATTAPATIAGTLAVANAEELAAVVITECANPGAPMIYTSEATPANMKTGEINYKAPEYPLICAGAAQMARFYKIPSLVADVSLEEAPFDSLSFERNVLKVAMSFMSHTDLSPWLGSRDLALSASLSQVILDAEVCEHARAYLRRFELNDDTLALDLIHKVGPGGHFLGEKHTLEHFKKEIWSRELSDAFVLDPVAKGTLTERAKAKVREILATYTPPPVEEGAHKKMERILGDAEKDILGDS
ncbi:MAG: trimethylamine methyltransferase family protein [Dehalococcoidia bacterium]|nr:trimethylamine methyltransferase family protein [Dehalococcoidia bacterium]